MRARRMIQEGAREALRDLDAVEPYVPGRPTTIKIQVNGPEKLAEFKGRAGVEITGPDTAESRAVDWLTAWNQFWPFA